MERDVGAVEGGAAAEDVVAVMTDLLELANDESWPGVF